MPSKRHVYISVALKRHLDDKIWSDQNQDDKDMVRTESRDIKMTKIWSE